MLLYMALCACTCVYGCVHAAPSPSALPRSIFFSVCCCCTHKAWAFGVVPVRRNTSSVRVPCHGWVAWQRQQLAFLDGFTVGEQLNVDAPGNAEQGECFLTVLVHNNPAGSALLLFLLPQVICLQDVIFWVYIWLGAIPLFSKGGVWVTHGWGPFCHYENDGVLFRRTETSTP